MRTVSGSMSGHEVDEPAYAASTLVWSTITPLGGPVVPDV